MKGRNYTTIVFDVRAIILYSTVSKPQPPWVYCEIRGGLRDRIWNEGWGDTIVLCVLVVDSREATGYGSLGL